MTVDLARADRMIQRCPGCGAYKVRRKPCPACGRAEDPQ